MSETSSSSVAADEVIIYDNGAPVGTARVVNGKWTAPSINLSVGSHRLDARIAGKTSNQWSISVLPPYLEFTDFQNGSLNGWRASPSVSDAPWGLYNDQGNYYVYLRYLSEGHFGAGNYFRKTINGVIPGKRYRVQISAQRIGDFKIEIAGRGWFSPPEGSWGEKSWDFVSLHDSIGFDCDFRGQCEGRIDNIRVTQLD